GDRPLASAGPVLPARTSVAGQAAVGHAVRARGLLAQAGDLVLQVGLEVALEPVPVRRVLLGALEGEDVGRHAVQEPAVVGDDHGAAGELQQSVLERAEGLHVQVVRRLVQEQHVAALLEGEREVQAVALAAGEHAGLLLLVRALEAELADVGARGDLDLADLDEVEPVGDDLPEVLLRVDVLAVLVDVADLDALTDLQLAAVELLEAHDGLEQGGLADAVGADAAHDAVRPQGDGEPVDEQTVPEALLQVLAVDDLVAQPRARRDGDLLEVELAGLLGLRGHLLVAGKTRLGLRLAALGVGADPVQLLLEAPGELLVLLALDLEALLLLLQIGGVVALVGVEVAAVDLGDPLGDVVEEVAVVGDGDDGALVLLEVLLEPEHALGVEVVGGLVQQQQVGLLQQQLAQRHATALAAGEVGDGLVAGRAAQRVHRLLELRVEVPAVLGVDLGLELAHLLHQRVEVRVGLGHLLADGVEALDLLEQLAHALLDVLQDGLGLVQRRLLQQDADAVAGAEAGLAVGGLVQAGHDLQD